MSSPFVRFVEAHQELPSTSDRALKLARDARLVTPALVVARRQTAGRGRGRNLWWSADGALTFSLVLDGHNFGLRPSQPAAAALATAVAVCDALQAELSGPKSAATLGIKWPNDVMAAGRKICGILIESPGTPAGRLVTGIGINLNNSWRDAPAEAGMRGVALCDLTGRRHDVATVLANVLKATETRFRQFADSPDALAAAWQSLCVLTGKRIGLETPRGHIEGRCLGIAADGALLIDTGHDHETMRVVSGTVTHIDPDPQRNFQ